MHFNSTLPIAPWQCYRGKGSLEGVFANHFWFSTSAPELKLPPTLRCRQPFWAWWWCTASSPKMGFQSLQLHQIYLHYCHLLHPSALWLWASLAMDAPGKYPLRQQHAGAPSATKHLLCSQGCKSTMCCLALVGGRFLGRAKNRCLKWMGGNSNPENQRKGPAKSPSNDPLPLQHGLRAIGSLHLRWLLGSPPLGIQPHPIRH